MNIVDPILFHCRWQPFAPALVAPGTIFNSVTYGQLEQFIRNIGDRVQRHGVARGKVAVLFIKDPILHIAFILALAKLGIVTVSAREIELPQELRVDIIFAGLALPQDEFSRLNPHLSDIEMVRIDKSWTTHDSESSRKAVQTDISAEEPCRIILTSGTTGRPKAVLRTNRHIHNRVHGLQTVYGSQFPNCSRIFLDMGLSTGIGFTILIYTLSRGGTLFARGGKALDAVAAIVAYQVQAIVASPKGLSDMVTLCEKIPAFSHGIDVVVSSGSMVTRVLSERVRARICANFVCAYGSTEAGAVAAAPASVIANINGAVGYITPGVTVDIVDGNGERVPVGKEGRLRIRSDCTVEGYLGDPENSQSAFREDGFYPGDLGFITPNGMLVVVGRERAVINIGGDKVSPEKVETELTSFPAVSDAAVFSTPSPAGLQQLDSAIVWRGEPDEAGLRVHMRRRLPAAFHPKTFISVDSIPRNSSGKIDRTQLSEIVAQPPNIRSKPH